jgi:hypothetical protein
MGKFKNTNGQKRADHPAESAIDTIATIEIDIIIATAIYAEKIIEN